MAVARNVINDKLVQLLQDTGAEHVRLQINDDHEVRATRRSSFIEITERRITTTVSAAELMRRLPIIKPADDPNAFAKNLAANLRRIEEETRE